MKNDWISDALMIVNAQDRKLEIYRELVEESIAKGLDLFPGDSILVVATRLENIKKIEEILSYGTDVDEVGVKNVTALHCAAWQRNMEIIKILLQNGASIEVTDSEKETPLYSAVSGLDFNLPEPYRSRPLLPVVSTLLNAGARPDAFSILYITPANITNDLEVKELISKEEVKFYEKSQNVNPVDFDWGVINYETENLKNLANDNKSNNRHLPQFISKNSLKNIQKSAIEGNAKSQFQLALAYDQSQEFSKAVKWYLLAANQGHVEAQYNLGNRYHQGKGVHQSDTEASYWYLMAAEQGCTEAQYNLGVMYRDGCGVKKNYEEALRLFNLAAEKGDANAQAALGFMYYKSIGVFQDITKALHWFNLASEQGHAFAQNNLGVIYSNGHGVSKDYIEGYKWFVLSHLFGYSGAVNAIKQLDNILPVEHIEKATKMVQEWISKNEFLTDDD